MIVAIGVGFSQADRASSPAETAPAAATARRRRPADCSVVMCEGYLAHPAPHPRGVRRVGERGRAHGPLCARFVSAGGVRTRCRRVGTRVGVSGG
ncbi:hypothetical protein GCM10009564_41400 [Streptomyces thermogriseus]|uniref:Uncharacterized protein n=1 Tax=Streptomyces thermogriseus TaxID=75292 RepID=A0ABN1T3H3_9ACTN